MPQRSKRPVRRESDPFEAVKPLVVLGLLGMILYGAYGVIRRGPAPASNPVGLDPPAVAMAEASPVADATGTASPVPQPPGPSPVAPPATIATEASTPTAPLLPDAPPASPPPLVLKAVPASPPDATPAIPPAAPSFQAFPASPVAAPPAPLDAEPAEPVAASPAATASPSPKAAAFATAWTDAHEKLAAARYAEALGVLSPWYDDPTLGPEETHRLEELLGQLAGTVIYSSQDHLLPPHIAASGENLRQIAAGLQVPWQVLGKINGVNAPAKLIPGEPLKVIAGPFDAAVSLSRRRLSLQLKGSYAGSFPVVIGRQVHEHVGTTLAVQRVRRGVRAAAGPAAGPVQQASNEVAEPVAKQILLVGGVVIEAVDDPTTVAETAAGTSLIVSARDLDELIDILGDGSRVFVKP
jgi:hypothetical protein